MALEMGALRLPSNTPGLDIAELEADRPQCQGLYFLFLHTLSL